MELRDAANTSLFTGFFGFKANADSGFWVWADSQIVDVPGIRTLILTAGPLTPPSVDNVIWQVRFVPDTDTVSCPPPNDSLLSDRAVRDSLGALFRRSKPDTMPDTLRREFAAHVLEDRQTGELVFRTSDDFPGATNCATSNDYELVPGQYILRAQAHTHPYSAGDVVLFCGSQLRAMVYTPGGSEKDWESMRAADSVIAPIQNGRHIREYIVDKDWVVRLTPENNGTTFFRHNSQTCPLFTH